MPSTRTLLFVYHSMTGGTRQMVEAAVRGAQAEGSVQVVVKTAAEAGPAAASKVAGVDLAAAGHPANGEPLLSR